MDKLTFFLAVEDQEYASVARHIANRLHPLVLQNSFYNENHFKSWLYTTAETYPRGIPAFMAGFQALVERGFFGGFPLGLGTIVLFEARIPV